VRPHQWAKNALLFLPLLGAHAWNQPHKLRLVSLAFVAFSLCASSVYVLNDLFDLSSDRRHPTKQGRPFASGGLPISWGVILCGALLASAVAVAITLPWAFVAVFCAYYLITLSYSLRLKKFSLIDVFVLAALYGLRVLAGGVVGNIPVSDWLLVFCLFLFFSLALAKRFTEIKTMVRGSETAVAGRGYEIADAEVIAKMGIASGYIAVVILALYVTNPAVAELYSRPSFLLLACPALMYWVSRIWLLAERGRLHDDPIVYAFTDKQSWLVVLAVVIAVLGASPK
jgi:4-hydroxybenzoate polyprenyltransferase